MIMYTTTTTK